MKHPPDDLETILIVDDTPANLTLLNQILIENAYKTRVAPNGKLALQSIQINQPDLILLDITLPDLSGFSVCEQIKAQPEVCKIPIIFVSAMGDVADKIKAFQVGGVDYITKPFEAQEVIIRVENQLQLHRLQKQLKEKNKQLHRQIELSRQSEAEMRLLLATTQAISRQDNVHAGLQSALRLVCLTIGWVYGDAWIPNSEKRVLECSAGHYAGEPRFEVFWEHSSHYMFPIGEGLPGRVWQANQPEWIEDISTAEDPTHRLSMARELGLRAAFAVPIAFRDQILAILVFYHHTATPEDKRLIELVNAVASQLGELIRRKQTEEILRITQERYHSIVENAVEGIYQTTPDGRYLSANLALAKMYGYSSVEELILGVQDIKHQLYVDPQRRQDFVEKMHRDNAVMGFESQIYRRDRSTIWISESARAVRDGKENLLYYEGTVSDISDRKRAEAQTEKLLLNILPQPIAQRLQQDQRLIADGFDDASVLFADLAGFTVYSSQKSSEDILSILNLIFSEFDQIAEQLGLEKIKTIGDAYMVVGGVPMPKEDHLEAIAEMALRMNQAIARINQERNEDFSLRIGINCGPVVAGVIGLTKFTYDLWGDTVNIASRMESTGQEGQIQVTQEVYERLQGRFTFELRGEIPIKGKGTMTTYWLTAHLR